MMNVMLQVLAENPLSAIEIAKLGSTAILAIGCVALWRAWALERAEVRRLNDARGGDLQAMLKQHD